MESVFRASSKRFTANTKRATTCCRCKTAAERALAKLVTRASRRQNNSYENIIQQLCSTLIQPDDSHYQGLLARLISSGRTSQEIFDTYIPDAARQLGEQWKEDTCSFAEVTIGTSRLQQTIRSFGPRCEKEGISSPIGHRALIIIPEYEQHTLGAFIVANQFRRFGVWVQIAINMQSDEICTLIEEQHFSFVGISAGSNNSLEKTATLTAALRPSMHISSKLILGGLSSTPNATDAHATGVDFVSSDISKILDFCELRENRNHALSSQNLV